jgi:DNA polymerase elongation subunit (family B)
MEQDLKTLSDDELLKLKKKYTYEVSKYKNLQLAKKVQLNSAYGALGNEYFRFFDIRQAEAITLSGQLAIRWIANAVNKYLNKILESKDEDFILAIDTDSIYVKLEKVVMLIYKDKPLPKVDKIVEVLDRFCEDKLRPFIDKSYQNLASYVNAYKQTMHMKRENIADTAIWTAKKRYIMNVYDSEGIRLVEPDLKIMGIEAVKSSTPTVCRHKIKEALKIIMTGDERNLQKYIRSFQKEFCKLPPEEVAFPRSVNGINKWMDSVTTYKKGTPIHVKASIVYNKLLVDNKLSKKYPSIQEGDKIRFVYLKEPNPAMSKVVAVPDILPEQMGLNSYIDYDTQFNKAFLDPLMIILGAIGWSAEKQNTFDHLM